MEDTDPWFILGNYGLTLFPHASGSYQLLHTERSFSRLNHDGSDMMTGRNCRAIIHINNKPYDLLVMEADTKRFGCGFAEWVYQLEGVELTRRFDTIPSRDRNDRVPAFRITYSVANQSGNPIELKITEGIGARYHFANWNNPPLGRQAARYPVTANASQNASTAAFVPEEIIPLVFDEPGRFARADGQPISVHLDVIDGDATCSVEQSESELAWLLATREQQLAPNSEATLALAVGWSDPTIEWSAIRPRVEVTPDEMHKQWAERLPDFADAEPALRGELQWHAHTLYAMATWDQRYQCVFIPQGTIYEFGLGVAAVTRDHAMHALPACSYDPDLALSVVQYLARHTDLRGHIQHTDEGTGIVPQGADQKSDNHLFALMLAVEYLERNNDTDCLANTEPFFPCGCNASGTLLDRIARWVTYLRDGVSTGANGLVRIMCSDLSDTLHSAFPHLQYSHGSYHQVFNGESYVNTTMALHCLRRLAGWLDRHYQDLGDQSELAVKIRDAAREYEARVRKALFDDIEGRPWVPRGRVGNHILGDEDAFCAPQAFIINNTDLPLERRLEIWNNVKPRLWDGEPFGVLLREGAGNHRCGMVWYAWTGMFTWALADIDPDAAREGLERLSLRRRAEKEPRQWMGLWSNSDVTWGYQTTPEKEIPGTTRVGYVKRSPHYCAHVHAWPLMLWYRLQDDKK